MTFLAATALRIISLIASVALSHNALSIHDVNEQFNASQTQQCGRAHLHGVEFRSRHSCPVPSISDDESDPSSWAPWTHQPYCVDSNYCVYTNSHFRQNHGISIITTPESMADTSDILDILFNDPPNREPYPPPYKVEAIPNKGLGVIATRPIKRYELVMTDSVSVVADYDLPRRLKHEQGVRLLSRAMEQLPDPERLLTLARSSSELSAPVAEDVMKTNSFGLPMNDIDRMVVFPKISRINHACDPNSAIRWSSKTLENAIVALRDIRAGEEISISYSEFGLNYAERQTTLKKRWGFQCTCSLCTAPRHMVEQSDTRRERIKKLRNEVLKDINKRKYLPAIKGHREMIKLCLKEQLVSQIGEHYWILARLYSAAGDKANTLHYAKMAYKELKEYQKGGTEMDETIEDLKQFIPRSML